MIKIILASQSPRRSELLRQIHMSFETMPSSIEEDLDKIEGTPEQKAEQLSFMKAQDISQKVNEGLIIGADTIVVSDGVIMGKPHDNHEAFLMLKHLSGKEHKVITGVTVIDAKTHSIRTDHETTYVTFKKLTEGMIKRYIATGEPEGKAGAYGIQGIGAVLVEKIHGCYTNVVGLPLSKLSSMLEEFQVYII